MIPADDDITVHVPMTFRKRGDGRQPAGMTLAMLMEPSPVGWTEHNRTLLRR